MCYLKLAYITCQGVCKLADRAEALNAGEEPPSTFNPNYRQTFTLIRTLPKRPKRAPSLDVLVARSTVVSVPRSSLLRDARGLSQGRSMVMESVPTISAQKKKEAPK